MSRFWDKVLGLDELRFGLVRKLLGLIVIVVAVLTFFLPLVGTNPPVMDRGEWSAFDIVSYDYQADLVRSSSDLFNFPVEIAVAYLLVPIAFYVVMIARSQRRLVPIAAAGLALGLYGWSRAGETFDVAIYRNFPATEAPAGHQVAFGELMVALLLIMAILLFLTASEYLDGETKVRRMPPLRAPRMPAEPPFIQAEVVPEEKGRRDQDDSLRLRS